MIKNKISTTLCIAGLLLLVLSAACEKLEDLIRFKFEDSADIVVPSQTVISTGFLKIPSPEVQTSSKQAFENNNTEAKYVKDARLTELKLTITAPQNQTFSFLNEIKIYISAPNQDEVLIASKTDIPASVGRELYLDINSTNLRPYIQGESYSIRTEVKVDEVTSQEIHIKANMAFSVTADVF
jgi:hypothetical protein